MTTQTEGAYRVGMDFNPSGNADVAFIKSKTAELIDFLAERSAGRTQPGAREASIAMTSFEEAAMWAVKAVTKKER